MSAMHAQATGTTTNSYVTIWTSSWPVDYRYFGFRFEETGGSNGITFRVQGSLNESDWDDLTLLDETGSAHGSNEVAVSANGSDQEFVADTADARSAVNVAYGSYRVQVKSSVSDNAGTYQLDIIAKE